MSSRVKRRIRHYEWIVVGFHYSMDGYYHVRLRTRNRSGLVLECRPKRKRMVNFQILCFRQPMHAKEAKRPCCNGFLGPSPTAWKPDGAYDGAAVAEECARHSCHVILRTVPRWLPPKTRQLDRVALAADGASFRQGLLLPARPMARCVVIASDLSFR